MNEFMEYTKLQSDSSHAWEQAKTDDNYKDMFDGFVFYKTIENHDLIDFYDGLISKDFEEEFFRRYKIQFEYFENSSMLTKLKNPDFRRVTLKEFNTKRYRKYRNFEDLIKSRDKYLSD